MLPSDKQYKSFALRICSIQWQTLQNVHFWIDSIQHESSFSCDFCLKIQKTVEVRQCWKITSDWIRVGRRFNAECIKYVTSSIHRHSTIHHAPKMWKWKTICTFFRIQHFARVPDAWFFFMPHYYFKLSYGAWYFLFFPSIQKSNSKRKSFLLRKNEKKLCTLLLLQLLS